MKFYKGDTFKHPSDGDIEVKVLKGFFIELNEDDGEYGITDDTNFTRFLRGFYIIEILEVLRSLKFINYKE